VHVVASGLYSLMTEQLPQGEWISPPHGVPHREGAA
jgi:hypothetical protein